MTSVPKLSVVIMNWARPQNVRRFVQQYASYDRVDEVIIWDSSQTAGLQDQCGCVDFYDLPSREYIKIQYVRSRFDFGLYPRFMLGAMCSNDAVLIVDDDIELPVNTVNALHDHYLQDPLIVHGLIGRNPQADGSYTSPMVQGPCQVVLTRALVTSPWLCGRAVAWGTKHVRELPGKPRGNGEDIVLSHVAMAESGRLNCAYKLDYSNVDFDDVHAISVREPTHGPHRTAMVKWCRKNILKGQVPKQ